MFQSLIGFKINWNIGGNYIQTGIAINQFQSLIGFKINWNLILRKESYRKILFQSLIGFKINWNLKEVKQLFSKARVSIPNRV